MKFSYLAGRRSRPRTVALATAGLLLASTATAGSALAVRPSPPKPTSAKVAAGTLISGGAQRWVIDRPLCPEPANPHIVRCDARVRVAVPAGTPGATRYVAGDWARGPAGGYTPGDLAKAYSFNPNLAAAANQLVAIVDWYNDPNALKDLNAFDKRYGLPAETTTSFRKVNQNGNATPLPVNSKASSGEIALDIESVRAVCHKCRILLVEANQPQLANSIDVAENTAARMGATEISNSFSLPEEYWKPKKQVWAPNFTSTDAQAFNQPGVVITASTGDDGWYSWDYINNAGSNASAESASAAGFPANLPTLVSVGGTRLNLTTTAGRASERVWDDNGADDRTGLKFGQPLGAGGGGCSVLEGAAPWQGQYPKYTTAHCAGGRLSADISAIADPATGFDILDSYGSGGWITVGGTSLAAPVTAALFALAGGAGGSAYPAASLYTNARYGVASGFDVTQGGNSFCGGDTTKNCGVFLRKTVGAGTNNPNALGYGLEDCSFPHNSKSVTTYPAKSRECNAMVGYDGPTGLGAPKGIAIYRSTAATLTPPAASTATANSPASFTVTAAENKVPSLTPTVWNWYWGDGTTTADQTTTDTETHTFTAPGTYIVHVIVADNAPQLSVTSFQVTVS